MASLSIPMPHKISDHQFVGDLMMLFERRKVKCGDPQTLERFANELEANHALRSGLFTLCTAISHMAAEDLTGEELLVLVARALGGPGVAKGAAVPEIPASMQKAFLEGYEAWGNRAESAMAAPLVCAPAGATPVVEETVSLPEAGAEPVEPNDPAEGGRTFNSALNIAMERSHSSLFIAIPTATVEDPVAGAVDQADGLPETDGGRKRVGAGFFLALAGVMAIASGLGGYYGYRSMQMSPGRGYAEVKPRAVASKQAPAAAIPVAAVHAAVLQAATKQATQSATGVTHPTSPEVTPIVAAAVVDTPVPVAAGAEDSSNSIVGYAPSAPRPVHPEDHATDISGTVMLEVSISAQGKVTDARAVSGPPELHAKAVQTVKQWRFKPTLVNGVPTEETTSLGVFLKGN